MPLNPFQQQVVDALIVALDNYEQELPPETIEQIQALVDPNSDTVNTKAFLQKMKTYPPDFQAEYERIKDQMHDGALSGGKELYIGPGASNFKPPEGLKSNISAAIPNDPEPQTRVQWLWRALANRLQQKSPQD